MTQEFLGILNSHQFQNADSLIAILNGPTEINVKGCPRGLGDLTLKFVPLVLGTTR